MAEEQLFKIKSSVVSPGMMKDEIHPRSAFGDDPKHFNALLKMGAMVPHDPSAEEASLPLEPETIYPPLLPAHAKIDPDKADEGAEKHGGAPADEEEILDTEQLHDALKN